MRIIRVDDEHDSKTMAWVAAGAVVGLVAGALIAERMSGRKITARMLWRRARGLTGIAARRWKPLLGTAMALRDAWAGREEEEAPEEEPESLLDETGDEEDLDEEEGEPEEEGLDARVLEAFANDPILAQRSVEIEEEAEGRIVLHGRVHTAREVSHAVTLARGVPGVASVKQRLAVRDRR